METKTNDRIEGIWAARVDAVCGCGWQEGREKWLKTNWHENRFPPVGPSIRRFTETIITIMLCTRASTVTAQYAAVERTRLFFSNIRANLGISPRQLYGVYI